MIRIFLAIVAALCLKTKLVDVSQAFLYGELGDEEIYMRLPKYLGGLLVRLTPMDQLPQKNCVFGGVGTHSSRAFMVVHVNARR